MRDIERAFFFGLNKKYLTQGTLFRGPLTAQDNDNMLVTLAL